MAEPGECGQHWGQEGDRRGAAVGRGWGQGTGGGQQSAEQGDRKRSSLAEQGVALLCLDPCSGTPLVTVR
jgi:hypothetical protein